MTSLNVPVPGEVARLAAELTPDLAAFETVRDRHTLVVKRFEGDDSVARLRERLRPALAGTPAFEARVTGVDGFEEPPVGPAPVAYLAVESPGLRRLHDRLCERFGAVEGLEGDAYVPHVTLARGGGLDARAALESLRGRDLPPVAWTVSELVIWSGEYREPVARIGLPA